MNHQTPYHWEAQNPDGIFHGAPRDDENLYQILFEQTPLPAWIFDLETSEFIAVNKSAIQHYGYSRREFLTMETSRLYSASQISVSEAEMPETAPSPNNEPGSVEQHRA